MRRRIKYADYKKYYSECTTVPYSYDAYSKTISVNIPTPKKFPSDWAPYNGTANTWVTPGGCLVFPYGYGKGPTQAYIIQRDGEDMTLSRIIQPGVDSIEKVIETVREFERADIGEIFLSERAKKSLNQHNR